MTGPAPAPAFRSVLAVCTGGPADADTLAAAAHLAEAGAARVGALLVVEPPGGLSALARLMGDSGAGLDARFLAERRAAFDRAVTQAGLDGVATVASRRGKLFIETIRAVQAAGHDLVVKAAEELGGAEHPILVSSDQHLVRKCPCAVWLTRGSARVPARRVLAAVDVNDLAAGEPETQAALNARIVDTAAHVAARDGATLRLVSVWDAPEEGLVKLWTEGSPKADALRYAATIETRLRAALDALAGRARRCAPETVRVETELVQGIARTAIPGAARDFDAEALVIGTVARTGLPGLIIGNTAEDILNSVACALVAVKPEGYTSPVLS